MYAIFIFNKEKTVIKCSDDDYICDVCKKFSKKKHIKINEAIFLYKGKKINKNIIINEYINKEDLKKNKINIFCFKVKYISNKKLELQDNINILNEIICPECGEICKIKFDDYKIILYECKNKHKLKSIEFEDFIETQNIRKSKIPCNNCNKSEEATKYDEYYICSECNKYLCILCKEIHNKEHNLIRYEDKNYICINHNKRYNSYCNKCHKNLCLKCENEHKTENDIIYYEQILPDINDTRIEEMKIKIENFYNNINDIIEKLNKIENKINIFYKIYFSIINNYYILNINYEILNNINEILNYNNNIIMNNINNVIEMPDDYKKVNILIDLYNIIFNCNKNIIKYKINNCQEKIKIFGNNFVKNNKDKCKIMHEKKEYDLTEYFKINNDNYNDNIIRNRIKNKL